MDKAWREFRKLVFHDAKAMLAMRGVRPTAQATRKLVDQEIARLRRAYEEQGAPEGEMYGIQG